MVFKKKVDQPKSIQGFNETIHRQNLSIENSFVGASPNEQKRGKGSLKEESKGKGTKINIETMRQ